VQFSCRKNDLSISFCQVNYLDRGAVDFRQTSIRHRTAFICDPALCRERRGRATQPHCNPLLLQVLLDEAWTDVNVELYQW
jgi:hypothetical protein